MTPLDVALVYRARSPEDGAETRAKQGMWSYPVPEFNWVGYGVGNGFSLNRRELARKHDVVFHEDWVRGSFTDVDCIAAAFWAVDSNTSDRRGYNARKYAGIFHAVLVDQDTLSGWPCPAHHLPYAVNERLFKPQEKMIDVGYYVQPLPEREQLREWLRAFCKRRGYSFDTGRSLPVAEYARRLGQARIVVHLGTHPQCRSHRIFDALACRSALVTSPLPRISGDGFKRNEHYLEWRSREELGGLIDSLLKGDAWQAVARRGYDFVLEHHTWAKRSPQLYKILSRLL